MPPLLKTLSEHSIYSVKKLVLYHKVNDYVNFKGLCTALVVVKGAMHLELFVCEAVQVYDVTINN